tara:strand:- start:11377 stop:13377 length:2001 start_codon:yes stop_codon:yes gene_type:complete
MNPEEKIKNLRDKLHTYNNSYYNRDESLISDFEFDLLMKKLEELEKKYPQFGDENSPTVRVGGGITKQFQSFNHNYPMYSLANTYSKGEITEWIKRIEKRYGYKIDDFNCELKFDGASINLYYENGELKRALTRGDGIRGDDVTSNIKTIKNVPLILSGKYPEKFEIRGEVILTIDDFNFLNKKRKEEGITPFRNPRNTASGSLKLQDSKEVASRKLKCFFYSVVGENSCLYHSELLEKSREWGFFIPQNMKRVNSTNEIFDFIDFWEKKKGELPYDIDGIVIKVNSMKVQNNLGFTAKVPRWAISYKYKAERQSTRLVSVAYQVGRTGAVTPVANFAPINLSGTIVKRASLHNSDQIEKLGLRTGDFVYVEKGGEIIPKIVGIDELRRGSQKNLVKFVENCPDCGSKLQKIKGEAQHYCKNENNCKTQIIGKIQHFVSRKAMNIESFGSERVAMLYNEGLITNIADIYRMEFESLASLDGMAKKSALNLLESIQQSKKQPFQKVLFSLGIRHVGETVALKLANHFRSIENLINSSNDDLISVEEIGEKIVNSIRIYFSNSENLLIIDKLSKEGLNFKIEENKSGSNILRDKSIVISGTFQILSRDKIKQLVVENGGKLSSVVNSKTKIIIGGQSIGPSKKRKAEFLNIPIISENDFLEMLNAKRT